jgi:hypothetical protein
MGRKPGERNWDGLDSPDEADFLVYGLDQTEPEFAHSLQVWDEVES